MPETVTEYRYNIDRGETSYVITVRDTVRELPRGTRVENIVVELTGEDKRIIVRIYRYLGSGFTHHRESTVIIENDETTTYTFRDVETIDNRYSIDETLNHDEVINKALDYIASLLR